MLEIGKSLTRFAMVSALGLVGSVLAGQTAPPVPTAKGTARECASGWSAPSPGAKNKRSKNAAKELQSAGACVELAFTPLEVQEYLQSYSRAKHWTVLDEHMTEDTWSFSLAFTKDELISATRADSTSAKVEWRSGIALVQVVSTQLAEGFTRTIVRASFRGYGESSDQFATQREYWELASNNGFENSVVAALKAHFQPVP